MRFTAIQANNYPVIFEDWSAFAQLISEADYSKIFVIVDDNTSVHCLPLLQRYLCEGYHLIHITSGEQHKNLDTCTSIFGQLLELGADRKSLCINLGGGVIGDMGGFCAATFMRGMEFVQVPTTLLSQVDASVGGKLGVDFQGVKNIIGIFQEPRAVFISTEFLKSLPHEQLRSGYAEVLKHALIQDASLWEQLNKAIHWQDNCVTEVIYTSIGIKNKVVSQDWKEGSLRKILNFGHTIGHAVESLSFDTDAPLLHGDAIAIGMLCESYISMKKGLLSQKELHEIQGVFVAIYGHHASYVSDHKQIIKLMGYDKKNDRGRILCSFIDRIGNCLYDQEVRAEDIEEALGYYGSLRF